MGTSFIDSVDVSFSEKKYFCMKIAVIGLGYVGLPLALRFVESGVAVIGVDMDPEKVETLNAGRSYIRHIDAQKIAGAVAAGNFEATTDIGRIAEVEAVLICVPTPLNKYREPDISFVLNTATALAPYLDKRDSSGTAKLVVLESTTYPGTTDTEMREVLESISGLQAGVGFHLAYSPEREDPGRSDFSVRTIPKVVGGYTKACLERCVALYSKAVDAVYPVESCRVAEASKLTENIFRSVNIGLVNELKVVFDKMGINVWDVIDAAATKPFGYMPFYPGPGLGGHCIPIDPFYLTWKAREYDQHTRFIELAGEINTRMPDFVLQKVVDALNGEQKSVNGSRILILGLAYKPNVDDERESPSYVLMEKLEKAGATVDYHDPYVPVIRPTREHAHFTGRKSAALPAEVRAADGTPIEAGQGAAGQGDCYDCVLLATHHNLYREADFSALLCPLVDTRNAVKPANRPAKYYQA